MTGDGRIDAQYWPADIPVCRLAGKNACPTVPVTCHVRSVRLLAAPVKIGIARLDDQLGHGVLLVGFCVPAALDPKRMVEQARGHATFLKEGL